jgi:hypothetical protein
MSSTSIHELSRHVSPSWNSLCLQQGAECLAECLLRSESVVVDGFASQGDVPEARIMLLILLLGLWL